MRYETVLFTDTTGKITGPDNQTLFELTQQKIYDNCQGRLSVWIECEGATGFVIRIGNVGGDEPVRVVGRLEMLVVAE